jgi:hypothetical protein
MCVHVPFQFESEGSSIIHYSADGSSTVDPHGRSRSVTALERAMQTV